MTDSEVAWESVEPPDYDLEPQYVERFELPEEESEDEYPEDWEDFWAEQRYLGDGDE